MNAEQEREVIFAGCRVWRCVVCGSNQPGDPETDAVEPKGCWVCGPDQKQFVIDDLPPTLRDKPAAFCDHAAIRADGFCPTCGVKWVLPALEV
jgi:rubrerythrin